MSDADLAIDYVIKNEGGFTESIADPGGATNFGISSRFLLSLSLNKLRDYQYDYGELGRSQITEYVKNMTQEKAATIYKGEFWSLAPFYQIKRQTVCNYLFDMAVNMGIGQAIHIVQRAINAYHGNLLCVDDGVLGAKTLSDINSIGFALMPSLRSERAAAYRLIAASHTTEQKNFLTGWLKRAYCG